MDNIINISEAASLALHSVAIMAAYPERQFQTKKIATMIGASEAHLHKVIQRLVKTGFITSTRGPKGGVKLYKHVKKIKLLDILEAIDGPFTSQDCLLNKQVCKSKLCIFGPMLRTINRQMMEYLSKTSVSEINTIFKDTCMN
jgi:Rrf2 family transcriptional regulator, nitric oxide-sensitive transcriptional repressor